MNEELKAARVETAQWREQAQRLQAEFMNLTSQNARNVNIINVLRTSFETLMASLTSMTNVISIANQALAAPSLTPHTPDIVDPTVVYETKPVEGVRAGVDNETAFNMLDDVVARKSDGVEEQGRASVVGVGTDED